VDERVATDDDAPWPDEPLEICDSDEFDDIDEDLPF
jgi:hypothetical protein